ncbi:MAG: hypothetical protein Ta2D_10600 [Rickettsiales bacterium]|nr:MAG: hypothetical protein Ta2D_10600 [Rickettsiales bacterium]
MQEDFFIYDRQIVFGYDWKPCKTPLDVLKSVAFKKILSLYLDNIREKNSPTYTYIVNCFGDKNKTSLYNFFASILEGGLKKAQEQDKTGIFESIFLMEDFIWGFYNYWRDFERYLILKDVGKYIFDAMEDLDRIILVLYRKIREEIINPKVKIFSDNSNVSVSKLKKDDAKYSNSSGASIKIFRQTDSGVNVGICTTGIRPKLSYKEYSALKEIDIITSIVFKTPLFLRNKQCRITSNFLEVNENPINNLTFDNKKWLCLPLKVGNLLILVYFSMEFLANGVSLSNIFEIGDRIDWTEGDPDAILVFGGEEKDNKEVKSVFYEDKKNKVIVGYFNNNPNIDYFSSIKRMLMIIFSIKNLNNNKLAIKGLLLNILLKNGKTINLLLAGDTYSGKFFLESKINSLMGDNIKRTKIIFNDIGYLGYKGKEVYAFGTETGSFLKMKGLNSRDNYYSTLKQIISRSIFLYSDNENADKDIRIVTTMNSFHSVNSGYKIDYIINLTNTSKGHIKMDALEIFNDAYIAKKHFTASNKTTAYNKKERIEDVFFFYEFGNVEKRKEKMEELVDKIFDDLLKSNTIVAEVALLPNVFTSEIVASKSITDLILK